MHDDEFQVCLILKCIRGFIVWSKTGQTLMVLIILEASWLKTKHYLSHAMATRCRMEAVQHSTSLEVHISQSLGPNVHFILICNNNNNIRKASGFVALSWQNFDGRFKIQLLTVLSFVFFTAIRILLQYLDSSFYIINWDKNKSFKRSIWCFKRSQNTAWLKFYQTLNSI